MLNMAKPARTAEIGADDVLLALQIFEE